MTPPSWQFFIDVGGTFTDVVARRPDGVVVTHKQLSSGAVRGVVEEVFPDGTVCDARRMGDPAGIWEGYDWSLVQADGNVVFAGTVDSFDSTQGALVVAEHARELDRRVEQVAFERPRGLKPAARLAAGESWKGLTYELRSAEPAPVAAIRYLMGRRLGEPIGPVEVRLGTTRATNALLERKGAPVALVTTRGFGDVLRIGYQDRPELFKLHIQKREELTRAVVEIDERLSADGQVLRAADPEAVRRELRRVREAGIEALAICLVHAHVNPVHEAMVADAAALLGFRHVSVSSRVARMEGLVPRADTTVVDAYLTPVIRDYVAALRSALPQARLWLMTSAGGLIDAAAATGKDTILSGPAGGVVAAARIAGRLQLGGTIGFDMGGTSTDVSRVEAPPAEFEYTHETVKAGVRLAVPMLAVETVAAGGGSLCSFDGHMLRVGPESAGADPGPACYGRGGPLALTDANLFLGRIVPAGFPFPLDRGVVERRLEALAAEVLQRTGRPLTPVELAQGFVRIADAHMAAAIKRISIARGYDVRRYALNCFGGAGGQHACAVADLLGIERIVVSPFDGVFSALGLGLAEVKRIGERSLRIVLDDAAIPIARTVIEALCDGLRQSLSDEGIDVGRLSPARCAWDMCYAGQVTAITQVFVADAAAARGSFEEAHRRLYGYVHTGRAVEVRAMRVELAAPADACGLDGAVLTNGSGDAHSTVRMVVDGAPRTVACRARRAMAAGTIVPGPAVITESTATLVIDPGWSAEVLGSGDILLIRTRAGAPSEGLSAEADPVQLELFNRQFAAIAEQMGATLRRTALSTNVKERLDYSCALFTARGELVVNAPHIPVHLGGMSDCVKSLIEDVAEFDPGSVYVTNDPYRGGSHLNDITVITPVHEEGAETNLRLLFFVASRAHHAEIGGTRPGSMPPDATRLSQEGVLIRAFSYMEGGVPQSERLRALLSGGPFPSRAPEENLADVAAQVAANQTGVCELRALIARCGWEVVHAYMGHIQCAAELKMRAAVARIADGVYRFTDRLDDGTAIRVAVTIQGDRAVIDFGGTDPVHSGNFNANRAIVTSAVLYCLRCLIDEDIPLNAGVLAPVEIKLPECFLNPRADVDPDQCPAMAAGNVETSQRIVDCLFGALGVAAASQGTMNNLLLGNERFGYYETICGGAGAGPGFAGADAVHTHMTNTRLTDPEVLEARYPARLVRFQVRSGSGGRGRFRGGDGVVREIEFLERLEISIVSQRRTMAPYGLAGGGSGAAGRNLLVRSDSDQVEVLASVAQASVGRGDRLILETPGGGGYGAAV